MECSGADSKHQNLKMYFIFCSTLTNVKSAHFYRDNTAFIYLAFYQTPTMAALTKPSVLVT